MTITAKYSSVCVACKQRIAVGSKVSWSRGCPATHIVCPAPMPSEAPRSAQIATSESVADAADELMTEYEAILTAERFARLPKGIYRVSLTGFERHYGLDHVNVKIVPNAKYGNCTVSEWNGEGVGRLYPNGRVVLWNTVDQKDERVQAILRAVEIILGTHDPIKFAQAYAAESETCWRCGADLVDELSRERLMGPVCYRYQYGNGAA